MTLLLNDPPRQEKEALSDFVSLDKALAADIVSFHTPLTQDGKHPTYHLLNQHNAHLIQPTAIVINAARGGIIDEDTWLSLPTHTNIIDCWENEPLINPALYQKADIATPHIAGHSLEAKIKGSSMVYEALCQFWQQTPENHWQASVPHPQKPLETRYEKTFQNLAFNLVRQCYSPYDDDKAIRSNTIDDVYKKFEYYRRHYPIHHEWTEFTVKTPLSNDQNHRLKALGFKVLPL
jgi:Phosphoglycerate dehydrogenase and related dehydrogenases